MPKPTYNVGGHMAYSWPTSFTVMWSVKINFFIWFAPWEIYVRYLSYQHQTRTRIFNWNSSEFVAQFYKVTTTTIVKNTYFSCAPSARLYTGIHRNFTISIYCHCNEIFKICINKFYNSIRLQLVIIEKKLWPSLSENLGFTPARCPYYFKFVTYNNGHK